MPPSASVQSCARRREFIKAALPLAEILGRVGIAAPQAARMRLILLGTGGGPRPRKANSASAQVIVSGGVAYVVDCGNGVARQLVRADVPLSSTRHIFLT